MTNNVTVSGGSTSGNINVTSSSAKTSANISSGNGNSKAETINNAAWYWAQVSKNYAEQAEQDVNAVVNGMTASGNITLEKDGLNIAIGTKSYTHNQSYASSVWNIQHNLNKRCPKATVVDTAGAIFYPPINFIDDNNCQILLIGAMAGTAYLE